jgi:glucose/mannose transport system substrate-binding protein
MHLFETVLLGALGAEAYNGLWDGSTDWGGAGVTQAIENFGRMLDYSNTDSSAGTSCAG